MDVLAKTAKINRTAAKPGAENVKLSGVKRLMEQCQAVNDAGFSGTIRPENERYRFYRYRLRFRKRFKIANKKSFNHCKVLFSVVKNIVIDSKRAKIGCLKHLKYMNIPFIIHKKNFPEETQGKTRKRCLRRSLPDRIVIGSRKSIQVLAKIGLCLYAKYLCMGTA
jgi:hypothetical protein